ncbi:DUF6978 family protein [Streptococcus sp. DD10]|uniref:DUF6978 family protein n=1 Tax=Streptococcus sp. DD10 TaxID=1777878 RepID=UPI0008331FA7|nr:hypothetical protein [Streptococcus sp. DD10]
MDYTNLTDVDVQEIIRRIKHPKNYLSYDKIYNTIASMFGKIDIDETIIDDDDIQYILHIFRGKHNAERFSIHLRLKEFTDHIVRVDIHPSNRHENPDGTIITGSHIHIYSNRYEKRDRIAIPLANSDFPNITQIVDVFSEFVNYTNIQKESENE